MPPSRHRLWVERLAPGALVVTGERAHYLANVLRLERGARLTLLGGDGRIAEAEVTRLGDGEVELALGPVAEAPGAAVELTVAMPAPKGERADWVVEKLTELGAARIVWLVTERSIVLPRSGGSRAERWQRLAQAAAKQAGRGQPPTIEGPRELGEVLREPAGARYVGAQGGAPLVLVLAESPPRGRATLLIGPEGGFTPDELSRARQSGYLEVGLAPHILRMETAAIAGAGMIVCGAPQNPEGS